MCGIVGFVGKGDERILKTMTDALAYRGPDGEGYFFDPADGVGLGHRRLAIIDLESGSQPIYNERKTVAVVFNGEIYNFQMLRNELEARHQFKTRTDTEVIIHLYEEQGEKCFEKLEGMFAIALWDTKKKKLLLARDRFGEKPLYWTLREGTLVFASEPKALFNHPLVPKELDANALFKYLCYEYVPSPQTIFRAIQKLEPGCFLVWERGTTCTKSYYQLAPRLPNGEKTLEEHVEEAVKNRMIADVPLGVFLSGGIDSSTIAYFAQKHSWRPIKTFSIGFEEQTFDESGWAKQAAKRIGTDHHERLFTKKELLETLPNVTRQLDEPLADASLLPTYLLSLFAREHVTVALGGDGGDELFLGYPTFLAHRFWPFYGFLPAFIKTIIKKSARILPVSHSYFSFDFKTKRFLEETNPDDLIRNQLWLGAFHPREYLTLLTPSIRARYRPDTLFEDIDRHRSFCSSWDRFSQIDYLYLKHYMAEDILTKVDRASMYCSLEIRSPFLDTCLVEYAFFLPLNQKLRWFTTKYALKQLMAPRLGKDIALRKKQGFAIPLAHWLAHDLRDMLLLYLNSERIMKGGIFNPVYVGQLMQEHMTKKADHRKRLWTLLIFEMWRERWGV